MLDVSAVSRTVTVGSAEELDVRGLTGVHLRWTGAVPVGAIECLVQLRAHGDPLPAVINVLDADHLDIELPAPARGIAPGQTAVIYDGRRVLGSATIERTRR